MTSILLDLALFLYAVAAPGVVVAAVLMPERDRLEQVAAGMVVALFAIPLLHFVVAVALGTHVSRMLVAIDATALLLLAAGLHRARSSGQHR